MPLRPVVFVGVGGSGNKTLRTLRQSILRRLRRANWTKDDLPAAWQMVAIDTITTDSPDGYAAPLLPGSCYFGLVPKGRTYDQIVQALASNTDPNKRQDAFAGWLAPTLNGDVAYGAGQNRAVGRAIAAANLAGIKGRLQEAHDAAKNGVEELAEVADLLGASGVEGMPFAVVISSLSGGTGSGMFLEVIEALKAVDHNLGQRCQAFLYGPEVFQPLLDSQAGSGIAANTLAATMEVTAGLWRSQPAAGTEALYQGGGLGQALTGGRPSIGTFYNFIIGAKNLNGDAVGTMDDAYRATGDALTALVVDEKVLAGFTNFFRINTIDNSPQKLDRSELKPVDPVLGLPFTSLGSGRVSLGMEAFAEYAAEVVGRSVVEQLLFPQYYRPPAGKEASPQTLIAEARDGAWYEFLTKSGLNERNPANDVVDGISPPDSKQAFDRFAADVVNKATGGVGAGAIKTDELSVRLVRQFQADKGDFLPRFQAEILVASRAWARAVEPRLLRLVSENAQRLGLSVAEALVAKLRSEVEFSITQIASEAKGMENALDGLPGQLQADLSNGGFGALAADHPNVKKAQGNLAKAIMFAADALRYSLAVTLLRDINDNLLAPLERSLRESRAALLGFALGDKTADGRPNPLLHYPNRRDLPGARFQPGPTEYLLIDPNDYPRLLEDRVRASLSEGIRDQWFERLSERSVLGLPIDERGDALSASGEFRESTLFTRQPAWMPAAPEFRWGEGAQAAKASYQTPTEPHEFASRAKRVISDPETALGKFVNESLQNYLDIDDVAERTVREDALVRKLKQAFSAGAPLASINKALVSQLHPDVYPDQTSLIVSSIPVAEGSSLYTRLKNELEASVGNRWDAGWFGPTRASQIDVFQALDSAMHAMAFSSLYAPVFVRWQGTQSDPDARANFWSLKRARPLLETLPISDEALSAFIRGWVISGWLDLRRETDEGSYGPKAEVFDPTPGGSKWLAFPHPLLGFTAEGRQLLPAVLKSLGIAMVQVNAQSSLEPLAPYRRMMTIGREMEGVKMWILQGRTLEGAPVPKVAIAGSSSDTAEARREALLKSLDQTVAGYERAYTETEHGVPFIRDPSWELRTVILPEYQKLREQISQFEDEGTQY